MWRRPHQRPRRRCQPSVDVERHQINHAIGQPAADQRLPRSPGRIDDDIDRQRREMDRMGEGKAQPPLPPSPEQHPRDARGPAAHERRCQKGDQEQRQRGARRPARRQPRTLSRISARDQSRCDRQQAREQTHEQRRPAAVEPPGQIQAGPMRKAQSLLPSRSRK